MSDVQDWNRKIIEEFHANEGRVGGQFEGAPVLLLHTTGARTGQERVNPMMFLDLDGHRYVFASKAGADTHPDWYHNLVAHPDVTVEVGTDTYAAQPGLRRIPAKDGAPDSGCGATTKGLKVSPADIDPPFRTPEVFPNVSRATTAKCPDRRAGGSSSGQSEETSAGSR
jgi:deazaflavin-dependent oxidoreductase (nitroreductase family)